MRRAYSSPPPLAGEVGERSEPGGGIRSANPLPNPPPQAGEGKEKLQGGREKQFRREKRDIHGWIVLDKPVGMTSTHAVGAIKRLFQAKRAGHAGTLDPLASGCLPIALGEATKTVPFVMNGRKVYRFTVRWGEQRDTDDADGSVTATSNQRPTHAAIESFIPRFTGTISQVPPRFSAVKIGGERAYDLARDGVAIELDARPVDIHQLELVNVPDPDHAEFEAECGKGTYVRALARDMGHALGCLGHIEALRRLAVGPFGEDELISLEQLASMCHRAAAGEANLAEALLPIETALDDIPALAVSRADAARLQRGQTVLLRGRDAPIFRGMVYVTAAGRLVALAEVDRGEIIPKRVFNLAGLMGSRSRKKGTDDVARIQPQG